MRDNEIESISAWLDGETDEKESKQVESILQADAEASVLCADFRKLDQLLDEFATPSPKPELSEIICISAQHTYRGNAFLRARYLVPLATAAAFVIAVLVITSPWSRPTQVKSISAGFDWSSMTITQRLQARKEARAYLHLSPQQQKQILENCSKELSMEVGNDKKLGAVMASFTPEQFNQLKKLDHEQRMEVIKLREQELVSKGIIAE